MKRESSQPFDPDVVSGRHAVNAAYQDASRAKEYIRSRYEDDPFGRATHEHQVRLLRRIITRLGARHVLEVAPGPARLTVHLPRVDRGVAVEQSPAMIRVATERLSAFGRDDWQIEQGDAFALPYQAGEFDLALSFKLVRHFDRSDRQRLLENLRNAVRSGGHVLLDVPNELACRWLHRKWGVEKGWIEDHWFSINEFRAEARQAGFADVRFYPVQPLITAQYYCWSQLWRIWPRGARVVGRSLERVAWGQPLEWLAVCRCG